MLEKCFQWIRDGADARESMKGEGNSCLSSPWGIFGIAKNALPKPSSGLVGQWLVVWFQSIIALSVGTLMADEASG